MTSVIVNETTANAEKQMDECVEAITVKLAPIRTGRADPRLLDPIKVPYYGSPVSMGTVATISATDSRTLSIEPFDSSMIPVIVEAITESSLGIPSMSTTTAIRLIIPALTEKIRAESIEIVETEAEQCRSAIRRIRAITTDHLRSLNEEGECTDAELRHHEDRVQNHSDSRVKRVTEIEATKKAHLQKV